MQSVNWDDIHEDVLIDDIRRRIVTGTNVMLGRIFFPKGAKVPAHSHESEQITNVLTGALSLLIEGDRIVVKAGQTLVIPSNVPHGAEALEDTDVIDTFSPIRTDWLDGSDAYLHVGR